MNRDTFLLAIMMLQNYFGKELKREIVEIYWNCLKRFSDDIFSRGVDSLVKNFHPTSTVPFPLIADFLSAMGISGENRAHAAVAAVKRAAEIVGAYKTPNFGDPALHATINRFGGWPEIAHWANHGKWDFQEKNFMRAYEAALECGEAASPPSGFFAIDNAQKNQSTWTKIQKRAGTQIERVEWFGADFSHQIENKNEDKKELNFELAKMIDGIGKKVE